MNHAIEAVGWTLINFCWQAALIAVVYWILDLLCSWCSSRKRYLLSLSALLLMGASAAGTMVYEVMRISSSVSVQTSVASGLTGSLGLQALPSGMTSSRSDIGPLLAFIVSLQSLLPWMDLAWLIGVACFSIRTITGWRTVEKLRSGDFSRPSSRILKRFSNICDVMHLKNVSLRISECVGDPLTMGVLRPLVLMPASAILGLSEEQIEVVLAHELAHVARMDYFWNLIQTAIETLFFFHPAVWWLGQRVRHQRELCCDDAALSICSDRHIYATALLRLEELRHRRTRLAMALTGNQSPSNLRERIARILGKKLSAGRGRNSRPLSAAILFIALGLFFVPLPKVFGGPVAAQPHSSSEFHAPLTANPPQKSGYRFVALSKPSDTQARHSFKPTPRSAEPSTHPSSAGSRVSTENIHGMAGSNSGGQTANEPSTVGKTPIPPGYAASLRAVGIAPENANQLISLRMFGVTPLFVREVKAAGFTSLSANQAVSLRIQGVTPRYAASIKRKLPRATVRDVIELRIMHVDAGYIAEMRRDGIQPLTIMTLLKLRAVGYGLPANRNISYHE